MSTDTDCTIISRLVRLYVYKEDRVIVHAGDSGGRRTNEINDMEYENQNEILWSAHKQGKSRDTRPGWIEFDSTILRFSQPASKQASKQHCVGVSPSMFWHGYFERTEISQVGDGGHEYVK